VGRPARDRRPARRAPAGDRDAAARLGQGARAPRLGPGVGPG
jgi:hypothetical protein